MRNHDVEMPQSLSFTHIFSGYVQPFTVFALFSRRQTTLFAFNHSRRLLNIADPISDRCAAQNGNLDRYLNGTRMKPGLISTSPSSKCVMSLRFSK